MSAPPSKDASVAGTSRPRGGAGLHRTRLQVPGGARGPRPPGSSRWSRSGRGVAPTRPGSSATSSGTRSSSRLTRARPRRRLAGLRPHRPRRPARNGRRERHLLHRPHRGGRPEPGAGRRRLAGAGGRALLPGHRPAADGAGPAPPLRHPGPHPARHRGRALRRARRSGSARVTATGPRGAQRLRRAHRRPRDGPHRAGWATSSPPSRASRTRSSAPSCRACWSCRAVPAPARPSWRCTAPPTCSTPTASRSRARACSWSGPTGCSWATSSRCCPRSARPASSWRCSPTSSPTRSRCAAATEPATARVKGDLRMAKVLAKAVRDRRRPLRDDLVVGYGVQTLRLTVAEQHPQHRRPTPGGGPAPTTPARRFVEAGRLRGAGRQRPGRARPGRGA